MQLTVFELFGFLFLIYFFPFVYVIVHVCYVEVGSSPTRTTTDGDTVLGGNVKSCYQILVFLYLVKKKLQ